MEDSDNLEDYIDPKHRIVYNSVETISEVHHSYKMTWDGKSLKFYQGNWERVISKSDTPAYFLTWEECQIPESKFGLELIHKGATENGKK